MATYGVRSRLGGFADVMGNLPATLMPKRSPPRARGSAGPLRHRRQPSALGAGRRGAGAGRWSELDLMVSLDFYVTETSKHADYILPATTYLEREDVPVALMGFLGAALHAGHARRGAAPRRRPARSGASWTTSRGGSASRPTRCGRCGGWRSSGSAFPPWRLIDAILRLGPAGDRFGLPPLRALARRRWSARPTASCCPTKSRRTCCPTGLRHPDKRVHIGDGEALTEIERLGSVERRLAPIFPLRLIGLRELRSHNSWMHNAPLLMRGGRTQALRIHPDDARAAGLDDGDGAPGSRPSPARSRCRCS